MGKLAKRKDLNKEDLNKEDLNKIDDMNDAEPVSPVANDDAPIQGDCVDVIAGKHKGRLGLIDQIYSNNALAVVWFMNGGSDVIQLDNLKVSDSNCDDY